MGRRAGQLVSDVFFRGGGSVRLDFKPLEMDPAITQFTLDVDGQLVKYAHGPQVPQSIQWPGSKGGVSARIQITPPGPGGNSGQTTEGAWALFRLFDKARVEGLGAPEKFKVTFDVEGRQASFELSARRIEAAFGVGQVRMLSPTKEGNTIVIALRVVGWDQKDAGWIDNVYNERTFPTSGITMNNAGLVEKDYNDSHTTGARA